MDYQDDVADEALEFEDMAAVGFVQGSVTDTKPGIEVSWRFGRSIRVLTMDLTEAEVMIAAMSKAVAAAKGLRSAITAQQCTETP